MNSLSCAGCGAIPWCECQQQAVRDDSKVTLCTHTHTRVSSLSLTGPLAEAVIESARDCLESRRAYTVHGYSDISEMSSDFSSVRFPFVNVSLLCRHLNFSLMGDHVSFLSHTGYCDFLWSKKGSS